MSENTTTPINETVLHNDLTIVLKRTETERVKKGEEAIFYYTIDLAQFNDGKALDADDHDKYLAAMRCVDMLGEVNFVDTIQAKINQDCRTRQLEAGKDTYDMATKLANLKGWITSGFAGRQARKSAMDIQVDTFNTAMADFKKQLDTKTITAVQYATAVKAAVADHSTKMLAIISAQTSAAMATVAE